MNRIFGIFLLLVWASAGAEVFRQVAPDGSVTFSDTPAPGAERVDLPPAQTITLPPVRSRVTATQRPPGTDPEKPVVSYSSFEIVAPSQGQGIRANDGNVRVNLASQPALAPGHKVELLVSGEDGERVYAGTSMQFDLHGLSRGEHAVSARIKDATGESVTQSGSVSFFILRAAAGGR